MSHGLVERFVLERDRARSSVVEFCELYRSRPIARNDLGMGFNHCFATWFILRAMRPKVVVESGVWRGQSTWLIEQAVPNAEVIAIDPVPEARIYTSPRVRYETSDFSRLDWSQTDVANAVVFFDDHQNAYERLKDMLWLGFRHAIFEDNYPCGEGDFYSLRHLWSGFGHPHIQMSPASATAPGSDPVAAASLRDRERTASSSSRRLSSWTGSPISSRRRASIGTGITECLHRITSSGGP